MNTAKTLLLVAAVLGGSVAVRARQADAFRPTTLVVAENGLVRLAFDRSRKGGLAEFRCKASGRNLLSEETAGRGLYSINAVDAQGKSYRITSGQADKSVVTRDKGRVTITSHHDAPSAMTVTVTCRLDEDSALARWHIRVENDSDLNIRKVVFPVVEVPDSARYVLFPYCDGCLVEKPGGGNYQTIASSHGPEAARPNGECRCSRTCTTNTPSATSGWGLPSPGKPRDDTASHKPRCDPVRRCRMPSGNTASTACANSATWLPNRARSTSPWNQANRRLL